MESRMGIPLLKRGIKLLDISKISVKNTKKSCWPNLSQVKYLTSQPQPDIKEQVEVKKVFNNDDLKKSKHPLKHPDFFNVNELVKVEELMNARVHFGHKEGSLDNRMKTFIFGTRLGHVIFDLDKTSGMLKTALNFTAHIAYRGGIILFISQYPQHSLMIENTAKECGEFSHTRIWRIGMFTNSTMMYGAVTRLPDLCIFINSLTTVMDQNFALTECAKMLIPTIGIADSNCNPNLITYPVPGNDDSAVSIELYCKLFKEAILRGKRERQKVLDEYSNSIV